MRSVTVSVLKAELAQHLRDVKAGEELLITERGTPIARVLPFIPVADDLAVLVARGVVRPAAEPLSESFFDLPIGNDPKGLLRAAAARDREDRA